MEMQYEGYVTVFESIDGGTGDPANTKWHFFVGSEPFDSKNINIAETMKLAVQTSSKVRVTCELGSSVISEARIVFQYLCEGKKVASCDPTQEPKFTCEVRRYDPCDKEKVQEKPPTD